MYCMSMVGLQIMLQQHATKMLIHDWTGTRDKSADRAECVTSVHKAQADPEVVLSRPTSFQVLSLPASLTLLSVILKSMHRAGKLGKVSLANGQCH